MIGYITLGTADIKQGAAFYDAIAKEMETPRMMGSEADGFIAWGKPGDKAGLSIINPLGSQFVLSSHAPVILGLVFVCKHRTRGSIFQGGHGPSVSCLHTNDIGGRG